MLQDKHSGQKKKKKKKAYGKSRFKSSSPLKKKVRVDATEQKKKKGRTDGQNKKQEGVYSFESGRAVTSVKVILLPACFFQ